MPQAININDLLARFSLYVEYLRLATFRYDFLKSDKPTFESQNRVLPVNKHAFSHAFLGSRVGHPLSGLEFK